MMYNICGPQLVENIFFISVVIDKEMYNKYVYHNEFLKNKKNIHFISYDNSKENIFISKRYNEFIESYNYSNPAWFVFCHSDWEVQDTISDKLSSLDKNKIYGPIGCCFQKINGENVRTFRGSCRDVRRDGSEIRDFCSSFENPLVETLDCQAMFIHSSLIQKCNLRFDEKLEWDLYVEDFCINAKEMHNIDTNVIQIKCSHYSDSGFSLLPKSYYKMLKYLKLKYPNKTYAGVCSTIGGKYLDIIAKLKLNLINKDCILRPNKQGESSETKKMF